MGNNLIIVSDYIDKNSFFKKYQDKTDVLALTPIAISWFDNEKIPYLTIEDFYDTKQYCSDLKQIYLETEQVFKRLDQVCEKSIGFPHAYTGNINYFLELLADTYYLEKLSQKINKEYSRVFLFGIRSQKKLKWGSLKFSDMKTRPSSDTLSLALSNGIETNQLILKEALNIGDNYSIISLRCKIDLYFLRLKIRFARISMLFHKYIINNPTLLYEKLKRFKNNKPIEGSSNQNLFCIPNSYEVPFLQEYLDNYNLCDPVTKLRFEILSCPPLNYENKKIQSELNHFLKKYWPNLCSNIQSLFFSYHSEVVGRLSLFKKLYKKTFKDYDPKAILFSVGKRDVFDSLICYMANQDNIPIFYFQHGGSTVFFNNIYQKYVETNIETKKILILNSKVEAEYVKHDGSKCIALGSMLKYQWLQRIPEKINNKIIYLCSPFSFDRLNYIQFCSTPKEDYQISSDIVKALKRKTINLDIKPHPTGLEHQIEFYNYLIKINNCKRTKVIYSGSAEEMIKSYGLIIIDSLGSAMTSKILSLKVPVVLYIKNLNLINDNALDDLKERCYIVSNYLMLDDVITQYAKGILPSKWSSKIIDRYIYPIEKGDPGLNIANLIETICNEYH